MTATPTKRRLYELENSPVVFTGERLEDEGFLGLFREPKPSRPYLATLSSPTFQEKTLKSRSLCTLASPCQSDPAKSISPAKDALDENFGESPGYLFPGKSAQSGPFSALHSQPGIEQPAADDDGGEDRLSLNSSSASSSSDSSDETPQIDTDKIQLRILFDCIDLDRDGRVSTEELIERAFRGNQKLFQSAGDFSSVEDLLRQKLEGYSADADRWTLKDFTRFMHEAALLEQRRTSLRRHSRRLSQIECLSKPSLTDL